MKKLFLLFLVSAMVLFGCINLGGQPVQNVSNNTTVSVPAPIKPSFSITSPAEGEVVYTSDTTADVDLVLSTSNLVIKSASSSAKTGEGHFKFSLDGEAAQPFYTKTYALAGLAQGNHTLVVEIVNNDGTSYYPAIKKTVTFEVRASAPLEYVAKNYTVEMDDLAYDPSSITVKVGDSVTWVNKGSFPVSATCFINGKEKFDTKVLGIGQSATIKMNEVLDCEYYSTTHMAMKGKITVESNETSN